ncbi:hypothetical protein CSAL01_11756 [Colletotrichum salicis]|uniref:Uncharacterized protein n=1 Tax=Colletotrichum salicis TaxID=1209931 RepID=A0A135V702_9PEZI|nr:hypothetical protein CSAL01_11756 [Colletotrichum salicis]
MVKIHMAGRTSDWVRLNAAHRLLTVIQVPLASAATRAPPAASQGKAADRSVLDLEGEPETPALCAFLGWHCTGFRPEEMGSDDHSFSLKQLGISQTLPRAAQMRAWTSGIWKARFFTIPQYHWRIPLVPFSPPCTNLTPAVLPGFLSVHSRRAAKSGGRCADHGSHFSKLGLSLVLKTQEALILILIRHFWLNLTIKDVATEG